MQKKRKERKYRRPQTRGKAVELEDIKFHQCVRLARFENDRKNAPRGTPDFLKKFLTNFGVLRGKEREVARPRREDYAMCAWSITHTKVRCFCGVREHPSKLRIVVHARASVPRELRETREGRACVPLENSGNWGFGARVFEKAVFGPFAGGEEGAKSTREFQRNTD